NPNPNPDRSATPRRIFSSLLHCFIASFLPSSLSPTSSSPAVHQTHKRTPLATAPTSTSLLPQKSSDYSLSSPPSRVNPSSPRHADTAPPAPPTDPTLPPDLSPHPDQSAR